MHFHDHRLSPLPMQNPYAKFILAIKTFFVHRFSKIFAGPIRHFQLNPILIWEFDMVVRIFFEGHCQGQHVS